eukprot:scpid92620/ scgid6463/ Craniofacial development protein 2; p97 bucentaur protein
MVPSERNSQSRKRSSPRTNSMQDRASHVTSWSVRALVEDSGDARICRKRPQNLNLNSSCTVDRKFDLLVDELKCFSVCVAAIQETKWFGSDVWTTGEFTMVHSGRPLESTKRRKSIYSERRCWNCDESYDVGRVGVRAGREWCAVSSRIITARFKLQDSGTKSSSRRWTRKAGLDVKSQFYDDLQRTLDSVPERDILIVLGDFNARIGISDAQSPGDDVWSAVRGSYGLGHCNETGRRLLMWCAVNQLSVMNTWFEKLEYEQGTRCHPATKQYHLIDMIAAGSLQGCQCWSWGKLLYRPSHGTRKVQYHCCDLIL